MSAASSIAEIKVWPLHCPLNEPFAIATGAKTEAQNILVRVRLKNGVSGWGEAAPAFNNASQKPLFKALQQLAPSFIGKDITAFRPLLELIDEKLTLSQAPLRAALGMAVLDAWARQTRVALRLLFGGASDRLHSDVTVTLVPAPQAKVAAQRIVAMGVRTIKIKIGADIDGDEARVRAVNSAGRNLKIMLDANCGFVPRQSLQLLARLKKAGIVPVLFEQPAAKDDWKGLHGVWRQGKVPVAADESVACRADALKAAKSKAVQVINIKLMKCGILEAWDIALIARAAGLRLMIGGMVESPLAMTAGAHFAAGLGGFDFVDLDTPLWFSHNPMQGPTIGRGGLYDLSRVKAGIGVTPKPAALR